MLKRAWMSQGSTKNKSICVIGHPTTRHSSRLQSTLHAHRLHPTSSLPELGIEALVGVCGRDRADG
jgi:hypothetical protein